MEEGDSLTEFVDDNCLDRMDFTSILELIANRKERIKIPMTVEYINAIDSKWRKSSRRNMEWLWGLHCRVQEIIETAQNHRRESSGKNLEVDEVGIADKWAFALSYSLQM